MTFTSETVRMLFHQLPTEKQVWYAEFEAQIAKRQRKLHIDAVMTFGAGSEVCIRITDDYQLQALASDSAPIV